MLKNKVDIYEKLKSCAFVIFALFVGLREVTPLDIFTGRSIVTAAILLMGLAVIFCEVFFTKSTFRDKKTDILFVFLATTALSCLINFKYNDPADKFANIKALCEMVLFFFMLYPASSGYDKEKKQKLLKTVLTSVCILWFVLCLISVNMYFFNIEHLITGGSWGVTNQGFSSEYQRLWGVFQDQNYAGYVSIAVILSGIYFIRTSKRKIAAGILNAANILVQCAFITLSGSRSVQIILACSMLLYGLYAARSLVKTHKTAASLIGAVFLAAASVFVIQAGTHVLPHVRKTALSLPQSVQTAVGSAYDKLYEIGKIKTLTWEEYYSIQAEVAEQASSEQEEAESEQASRLAEEETDEQTGSVHSAGIQTNSSAASQDDGMTEKVTQTTTQKTEETSARESISTTVPETKAADDTSTVGRTDTNKDDISNGRFKRWKHAIQIFLKTPIFGTSPRNTSMFAKWNNPDTLMATYGIASHNGFIDVFLFTGILGALFFYAFIILALIKIVKKFFRFDEEEDFGVTVAIAFTFFLSALFVSDLVFIITIGTFMFWFNLGYASSCCEEDEKKGLLYRLFASVTDKIGSKLGRGNK